MGKEFKPTFKDEFILISEGPKLFRIIEPKVEKILPEEQKERDGIKNDVMYTVKCAIEGGEENGIEHTEFFPSYSKNEFGLTNLAGLMIKTEAIPAVEKIDIDSMRTEKFESKFKMSLPKRLFGAIVRHVSPKETPDKKYANLFHYMSVKEYNEKIAELALKASDKGSDKGKKGKTPPEGKEEVEKGKEKADPWA